MKKIMTVLMIIVFIMGSVCAFSEGNADADNAIEEGIGYWFGSGPNGYDMQKAQEAFKKAADLGDADAWYWLGVLEECEVEKDHYKTAFEYYQKAADLDSGLGLFGVGRSYGNGYMGRSDLDKCMEYYQKAVDAGCDIGYIGLGNLSRNGDIVEKDGKKALEYFEKAASSDDWYIRNYARMQISGLYLDGAEGVKQDVDKSFEWAMKAADEEYSVAYVRINYLYSVKYRKYKLAFEWKEKAAACGNPYNLGVSYENGEGVEKDQKRAVEIYKLSENGGRDAVASLAALSSVYYYGRGVRMDKSLAEEYALRAFSAAGTEPYEVQASNHSAGLPWAKYVLDKMGSYDKTYVLEDDEQLEPIGTGVCTANKVNLRREPKMDAGTAGQINKGDALTVLETRSEWSRISCQNGKGWIKTQYIQMND